MHGLLDLLTLCASKAALNSSQRKENGFGRRQIVPFRQSDGQHRIGHDAGDGLMARRKNVNGQVPGKNT